MNDVKRLVIFFIIFPYTFAVMNVRNIIMINTGIKSGRLWSIPNLA